MQAGSAWHQWMTDMSQLHEISVEKSEIEKKKNRIGNDGEKIVWFWKKAWSIPEAKK